MTPTSDVESTGIVTEQKVPIFNRIPFGFWVSLFVLAVVVTLLMAEDVPNPRAYLGLCLSLCTGLITVPLAFRICHAIFMRWGAGVHDYVFADDVLSIPKWFNEEMHFFEGSKSMCLAGLALGTLAVTAFLKGGFFVMVPQSAKIFGLVITFAAAFLAGTGLFAMYRASRAIWILGALNDVRVSVDNTKFGILQTGLTLVQCWIVIGLVWCLYTLSALLGLQDLSVEAWLKSYPVWLLAVPTFPLIFGSFFISQVPLHRRMIDFKRGELRRMDRLLEELKPEEIGQLTRESQSLIEFLQRQRAEVLTLPEWPFSGKSLFGLGASTIAAVLPLLVSSIARIALETASMVGPFLSGQ